MLYLDSRGKEAQQSAMCKAVAECLLWLMMPLPCFARGGGHAAFQQSTNVWQVISFNLNYGHKIGLALK
jgi:hypothetical protein